MVLIAKTKAGLVDALTERVFALHSYEVPCVVALPITGGIGSSWGGLRRRRGNDNLCPNCNIDFIK